MNDYEKWIWRQSWPESPICEWGIKDLSQQMMKHLAQQNDDK